ncbi:MAG: hypothetical protein AAFU79_12410, partial [Myxococcota bacterium]
MRIILLALMVLEIGSRSALAAAPELERAAAAIPKKDGFPITRSDQLFPLAEVRRGLTGVGFTVFEADVPEPFGVEVLGVLEGMLGPGEDVILARLTGERIRFTGVISGMSGSPVYIDGRLVGAVAYRFGSFAKEPIAGITPIERMLPVFESSGSPTATGLPLPFDAAAVLADRGRAPRGAPTLGATATFAPRFSARNDGQAIATPVAAAGLHPGAFERLAQTLEQGSMRLVAAGAAGVPRGGASSKGAAAGRVAAAPLLPGAPIAARLTRGDIDLSAIGTVTYVEGSRVLAFGHPFVGEGRVGFPMATASILNTLASEAGSYKQGLPAEEVGSISQDRLTAIGGKLGGAPLKMVPLGVTVVDGSRRIRTEVEIVEDPRWLSLLTDTVVTSAVLRRLSAEAGGTVKMKAGFQVGDRYLEVQDSYAAPAPLRVAGYAAQDAAVLLSLISRNDLEPASVSRVEVELAVDDEVRVIALETAVVEPQRVYPGQIVEITARLRPYRGRIRQQRLRVEIPIDAPAGPLRIHVGGGLELDRRDVRAGGRPQPRTLDGLLGLLAERRPASALYARLYLPQQGLRWGTELLPGLPVSARSTLLSQPELSVQPAAERLGP